jgi:hypothetical protein
MQGSLTDRRHLVESELFDVHARIERARIELERAEHNLALATGVARAAEARMAAAETALAHLEWCEARHKLAASRRLRDATEAVVAELEGARDGLLAKLVI